MLKSDAEHLIRRAMEETKAEFTEQQVQALAMAIIKISGRLVEEAMSSMRSRPGSKPNFFTD